MFELWLISDYEGPDGQTQDGTVAYFTSAELAEDVKKKISPLFPELTFEIRDSDGPLIDPSPKETAKSLGRNL